MVYFIEIVILFVLCLMLSPVRNKSVALLWTLQFLTLFLSPLVANHVIFSSVWTAFNIFFCFVNLYLITAPWGYAQFQELLIRRWNFFLFYKRVLYIVLSVTILINLVVWVVVMIFIPDISHFKASLGYTELYDSVPYFGLLFRYASVTRYIGLMAMPIAMYYVSVGKNKEAIKAAIMSSATLIAALAFYSRAQIFVYTLLWVCLYMFSRSILDMPKRMQLDKYLKTFAFSILAVFMIITYSRFTAMDYYGDRIPKESVIKNPIMYSIIDYSTKGFINGINQLEVHDSSDVLKGEQTYYDLFMVLSYFHFIPWTTDAAAYRAARAYDKNGLNEGNDSGTFHGYTCRMVKDYGYVLTVLIDLLFFFYVRNKTRGRKKMNLTDLTVLLFLMVQSINSFFYSTYSTVIFPLLFYIGIRFIYILLSPILIRNGK